MQMTALNHLPSNPIYLTIRKAVQIWLEMVSKWGQTYGTSKYEGNDKHVH